MPSTIVQISQLKADYPQFNFKKTSNFYWSPVDQTVGYTRMNALLFHELAHAVLSHNDYHQDIELLEMERDAWDEAIKIAKKYGFPIDDKTVQISLDTYRDWMHNLSTCPNCGEIGMQTSKNNYF